MVWVFECISVVLTELQLLGICKVGLQIVQQLVVKNLTSAETPAKPSLMQL